jgi:hypothetical protein
LLDVRTKTTGGVRFGCPREPGSSTTGTEETRKSPCTSLYVEACPVARPGSVLLQNATTAAYGLPGPKT